MFDEVSAWLTVSLAISKKEKIMFDDGGWKDGAVTNHYAFERFLASSRKLEPLLVMGTLSSIWVLKEQALHEALGHTTMGCGCPSAFLTKVEDANTMVRSKTLFIEASFTGGRLKGSKNLLKVVGVDDGVKVQKFPKQPSERKFSLEALSRVIS
ncbi:hypothetical protein ACLB2K_047672 [Fragaria x ananassa]